jgi:hypothetical protein
MRSMTQLTNPSVMDVERSSMVGRPLDGAWLVTADPLAPRLTAGR